MRHTLQCNSSRSRNCRNRQGRETAEIVCNALTSAALRCAELDYHKICRKQERDYWFKQKQNPNNLWSKDPKEFWNRLNMKSKGKPHNFWKIELSNYFKNLASSSESEQRNNQENEPENLTNLVQDIDSILNSNFDFPPLT